MGPLDLYDPARDFNDYDDPNGAWRRRYERESEIEPRRPIAVAVRAKPRPAPMRTRRHTKRAPIDTRQQVLFHMTDPRLPRPLRALNNGNRNGCSIVASPRVPNPKRTRAECDAEFLDLLVEKTLQSLMPLATLPVSRPPRRRGKRRNAKRAA